MNSKDPYYPGARVQSGFEDADVLVDHSAELSLQSENRAGEHRLLRVKRCASLGVLAALGFSMAVFVLGMRIHIWGEAPSERSMFGFGTVIFGALFYAVLGSLVLGTLGGLFGLLADLVSSKNKSM